MTYTYTFAKFMSQRVAFMLQRIDYLSRLVYIQKKVLLIILLFSLLQSNLVTAQTCSIYYVAPGATSTSYTPSRPGSLTAAITAIGTGGGTIRLEVGSYSVTGKLTLASSLILDGGYSGTWVKQKRRVV